MAQNSYFIALVLKVWSLEHCQQALEIERNGNFQTPPKTYLIKNLRSRAQHSTFIGLISGYGQSK